jgi:hypothetical protein
MNLSAFGDQWVFGGWHDTEQAWCMDAFSHAASAAAS